MYNPRNEWRPQRYNEMIDKAVPTRDKRRVHFRQQRTATTCAGAGVIDDGKVTTTPRCTRFGLCSNGSIPGCVNCGSGSSCNLVSPNKPAPLTSQYSNINTQITSKGKTTPPSLTNVQEWSTGATLGVYDGTHYYLGINPYDDQVIQEHAGSVQFCPLGLVGTSGISFAKVDTHRSTWDKLYLDTTNDGTQLHSGDWVVMYTPSLHTPFTEPDSDGPWFLSSDKTGTNAFGFGFHGANKYYYPNNGKPYLSGPLLDGGTFAFQIFTANSKWSSLGHGSPMYQGDPFFLWSWGSADVGSTPADADFRTVTNQSNEGLIGYSGSNGDTATDPENGGDLTPWTMVFRGQKPSYLPNTGDPMSTSIGTMKSGYTPWGCQGWAGNDPFFLYQDSKGNPISTNPPAITLMYFVATSSDGCLGYASPLKPVSPSQPSQPVVPIDPSQPTDPPTGQSDGSDSIMIYVGIGIAALMIIFFLMIMMSRK